MSRPYLAIDSATACSSTRLTSAGTTSRSWPGGRSVVVMAEIPLALERRVAAVDEDGRAGHERGLVAGQEHGQVGHLRRVGDAAHRRQADDALDELLGQAGGDGGADGAGADG